MINIIAALAANNVIGRDNQLPWHLPEDLKRFKRLTLGHPIIMGRKTWQSLGRPLPGRENVVISRQMAAEDANGVLVFRSLDAALSAFAHRNLFIIGGASLYAAALEYADRMYLTVLDQEYEGDTFFPQVHMHDWDIVDMQLCSVPFDYAFITLDRRAGGHIGSQ